MINPHCPHLKEEDYCFGCPAGRVNVPSVREKVDYCYSDSYRNCPVFRVRYLREVQRHGGGRA